LESTTKNRKTREQISRMVERSFAGLTLADRNDTVVELTEGWFNAAYAVRLSDGREVILKIAPPRDAEVMTYEQDIMATEVAAMRLVSQNQAIPVPEIFYYDTARDVCDSDYFFMEKLSGELLEHVKDSLAPEIRTKIERRIGEIVREINGFTGEYFGYPGNSDLQAESWKAAFIKICDSVLEDGRRKNVDYGFEVGEIRDAILKHAPTLEAVSTPRLVHWDAWDLNFFVQDGEITGLLDFERALWGDPLMEAQFRALAFGGVSESMQGYGKTTFTHKEDERCHLYTLHLALVMKTECAYRHYDTDFVSNAATQLMVPTMAWLRENDAC